MFVKPQSLDNFFILYTGVPNKTRKMQTKQLFTEKPEFPYAAEFQLLYRGWEEVGGPILSTVFIQSAGASGVAKVSRLRT
jgi:hypothetical protein